MKDQRYWWIWDYARKRFVNLGNKYIQGNQYPEIEVDLEPGLYDMGCGPRGPRGIRQRFEVAGGYDELPEHVRLPDDTVLEIERI